ncbi:carbohydrate-binding protein [Marinobacter fonticola]|uniref:carbohydrate-binding protein n=1 Tax=Marinobacter fonticola TaxID=2603215 RepID=UPI0011E763C3|nr:carbohydrate-binding protein [Marinobacter fonticola]
MYRSAFLLVLLTLFASTAAGARNPCSPDASAWVPSRYYDAGAIVFHGGDWYVAREWQEGRRPGRGEFAWQALDAPPDCARADVTQANSEPEADEPGRGDESVPVFPADDVTEDINTIQSSETKCKPAPTWTFSDSYTVGRWVTYEGQVYRAIRPSTGDMPGVVEPPHWVPVEANCPAQP